MSRWVVRTPSYRSTPRLPCFQARQRIGGGSIGGRIARGPPSNCGFRDRTSNEEGELEGEDENLWKLDNSRTQRGLRPTGCSIRLNLSSSCPGHKGRPGQWGIPSRANAETRVQPALQLLAAQRRTRLVPEHIPCISWVAWVPFVIYHLLRPLAAPP